MAYPKPARIVFDDDTTEVCHHQLRTDTGWLFVRYRDGEDGTYYPAHRIREVNRIDKETFEKVKNRSGSPSATQVGP